MVYLLGLDAGNAVVVHLCQHVRILLSTANARRGNEMRMLRQSLGEEHLVACSDDTAVVQVDVVDEQPRADAVISQFATLLSQLHDILVEQQAHLVFGVCCQVASTAVPHMAELAVTYFIQSASGDTRLHTRHQIHPQGYLRTVKGCLLDDALGAWGHIRGDNILCLIGSVAQEVTLEHRLRTSWQTVQQTIVRLHDGFQLLRIRQAFLADVNHCVIFLYFRAVFKAKYLGTGILKIYL